MLTCSQIVYSQGTRLLPGNLSQRRANAPSWRRLGVVRTLHAFIVPPLHRCVQFAVLVHVAASGCCLLQTLAANCCCQRLTAAARSCLLLPAGCGFLLLRTAHTPTHPHALTRPHTTPTPTTTHPHRHLQPHRDTLTPAPTATPTHTPTPVHTDAHRHSQPVFSF